VGRFGAYVQHGRTYGNLANGDDVLSIGLNRAVTLIEERRAMGPRRGRFGADPGRSLGEHPERGGPVVIRNGRYGPYVSHDGVNATLPPDMVPEAVTLEQAMGLLEARAARGLGKKQTAKPVAKSAAKSAGKPSRGRAAKPPAQPRRNVRKARAKSRAAAKAKSPPRAQGRSDRKRRSR
jgi:DNA topoisomerase-1